MNSYALWGSLDTKTFEIKRRSYGVAQVFLFINVTFLFIPYLFLLFAFICPSGNRLKSNQKVKAVNLFTKNVLIPLKILKTLRAKTFLTLHSNIFLT